MTDPELADQAERTEQPELSDQAVHRSGVARTGAAQAARGFGWIGLYVLLAVGPLAVALTADPPPARGVWIEFSVALGFVGLSLMGLQFAVVSRFSSVNAPYGLDVVLQYHRQISFVAFTFVVAHPIILLATNHIGWDRLNVFDTTGAARAGIASVLALVALLVTSVWRKQLGLRYEVWRVAHGVLATAVVMTALIHIERIGYYVDGPIKRGVWVVMSLALVTLLINVRVVTPWRLMRRPWEVVSVEPERGSVWHLTVRPVGHPGIRFLPGQFAWIRVGRNPVGVRENPFSFSSSAEQHPEVSFGIKESGDFTSTIGSVEPGTRVYLDGPYGVFSYERMEGPCFVFVAGGVGISPILSMLRTLADRGDRRPCLLLYGNARWEHAAFREELASLEQRLDLRVVHVIDDPPEGWSGERGFIDDEVLERHLLDHPERARYFLCGPPVMMTSVETLLEARNVPPEHIDFEQFDLV